MIMGLVSTDWLMAAGWRQGLFMHCIEEHAEEPLPFNTKGGTGCYTARDVGMYLFKQKSVIHCLKQRLCFVRSAKI